MKNQYNYKKLSLLALCLAATTAMPAYAQLEQPLEQLNNVLSKNEEALKYSAVKVKAGIRAQTEYNDNIFRSPSEEEQDLITRIIPRVRVSSDLEKHEISFDARLEQGLYLENTENDYTDIRLEADGRYDINDFNALHLGVGYEREHIDIGSFIDDPESSLTEPVTFDVFYANTSYEGQYEKIKVATGVDFSNFDFDNVLALDGDLSIQDDRDRFHLDIFNQIGYEYTEGGDVYIRGTYSRISHDERIDSSEDFTRNSDGFQIVVGTSLDNDNSPFSYNAYVGFTRRDFDASELPDVSIPDLFVDATWKVDERNKLDLDLSRTIRNSFSTGESAFVRSRARVRGTHKLNDQIAADLTLSYTENNFETNTDIEPLDREDDIFDIRLGISYEPIEDLVVRGEYRFDDRSSNDDTVEFDRQRVGLTVSYKF